MTEFDHPRGKPAGPAIPSVVPWRHALTICAAALGLGLGGYVLSGSAGSMAALAGFAVGLFAALSGGRRGALIACLGFVAAAGLVLAFSGLPMLLALSLGLSALATVEAVQSGTRMSVMGLLGIILVAMAIDRGGDVRLVPQAVLGLGAGYLVIRHLQLFAILPAPLASRPEAIRLGLFLAVGVVLSISLALAIDLPHSYWIVILFLSRCLMPMQDHPGALVKYGHGAALGVLAAVVIELAGTPETVRLLLALVAFGLALRFMPHPLPISSAGMTAGVLLSSAPTPHDATFRIEVVFLVIALILFLTLMLDRVAPRVAPTGRKGQAEAKARG